MNLRDRSCLERTAVWLEELLTACRHLGPLYGENPKLVADVARRARALQTVLHRLRAFLDHPSPGAAERDETGPSDREKE